MKKFIVLSIVLLMLAGFVITSSAMVVALWAGKDIYVGTLTVGVVGDDLVVTYNITAPWVLGETHLYVGIEPPTKSAPGQFPYGPEVGVNNEVEYVIPLTDFSGAAVVYIAAHAVVTNQTEEETAWTRGCVMIRPGKNWASYFKFTIP